jgi:RNA polymerase sigma-70 factor (ECF subfamily)
MERGAADSGETERLLMQVRGGDRSAFERLLALHRAYLRQLVELRMDPRMRVRVDPSDVVQEAQIEAARRLDAYLGEGAMPFRLWLRQLAQDRLLMLRRRHVKAARRTVQQEVALPEQSSLALAQQLFAAGSSPSERLSQQELARRVHLAVGQLPDVDREVLLMRTFEGLSFEEVGFVLEIEAAAARKRHGRALLRLSRILTEGGLTESQI